MKVIGEALTFDDVSLVPSFSDVLPNDVDLQTRLTAEISLNAPLLSAATRSQVYRAESGRRLAELRSRQCGGH